MKLTRKLLLDKLDRGAGAFLNVRPSGCFIRIIGPAKEWVEVGDPDAKDIAVFQAVFNEREDNYERLVDITRMDSGRALVTLILNGEN